MFPLRCPPPLPGKPHTGAAVLLSLCFTVACVPSAPPLPSSALLSCASAVDCPAGFICAPSLKRCLSVDDPCVQIAGNAATVQDDGTACPLASGKEGLCLAGRCAASSCGDGYVDATAGEQCDDGSRNSDTRPNACRTNCQLPRCGDGVIDRGESCDGAVGPNATCQSCVTFCSDGTADCDGNPLNGCECVPRQQTVVSDDSNFELVSTDQALIAIARASTEALEVLAIDPGGNVTTIQQLPGTAELAASWNGATICVSFVDSASKIHMGCFDPSGGGYQQYDVTRETVADARYLYTWQDFKLVRQDRARVQDDLVLYAHDCMPNCAHDPTGTFLAQNSRTLYFAVRGGTLMSVPKDGSAPASEVARELPVLEWFDMSSPFAADDTGFYYADGSAVYAVPQGERSAHVLTTLTGTYVARLLANQGDLYVAANTKTDQTPLFHLLANGTPLFLSTQGGISFAADATGAYFLDLAPDGIDQTLYFVPR